jgi:nicotinate-nucleotide adenylyltransferase
LPKPSYTAVTMAYLLEQYPQHTFSLIVGQDNLENFTRWKNYQYILDGHHIYVYPRPDFANSEGSSPFEGHPHVHIMPAPLLDISATYIRSRIKNGQPIRYLVGPEVEAYIHSRKLYT